jgi:hypothetical protein
MRPLGGRACCGREAFLVFEGIDLVISATFFEGSLEHG